MEKGKMQRFSKENGRAGSAGESRTADGTLSRAELITTVRRLGYVCIKVHEIVMGRLTTQGHYELAERFNDIFKPLADMLLAFDLADTQQGEEYEDGV